MNLSDISAGSLEGLTGKVSEMIARINVVFGREHNADGTHKIPCWVNVTPGSSDFGSVSNQTWTVPATTVGVIVTWQYKKHGNDMGVNFEVTGTTVAGTPANHLTMKIPGGFTAKTKMRNDIYLEDNGASVDGMAVVEANSRTIDIYRKDLANFTGGATSVRGTLPGFETTA